MIRRRLGDLLVASTLAMTSLLLVFFFLNQIVIRAEPVRQMTVAELQPLNGSFTISGTVTGQNGGKVVSNVEVFVWNRDQGSGFVGDTTDINGIYKVTLAVGNYDFSFNPPAGSGYASHMFRSIRIRS